MVRADHSHRSQLAALVATNATMAIYRATLATAFSGHMGRAEVHNTLAMQKTDNRRVRAHRGTELPDYVRFG